MEFTARMASACKSLSEGSCHARLVVDVDLIGFIHVFCLFSFVFE